MDERLIQALDLALAKEDAANAELTKARQERFRVVVENLPRLHDAGLIKVEVNRHRLNQMMGRPYRTKVMG